MKIQKVVILFFTVLLLVSCNNKKDIYKTCELPGDHYSESQYAELMNTWLDCLISERIKEKSKQDLYEDIKGNYIGGAFVGIDGKLSDSFLSYKALEKILSNKELLENINSKDPGIRYYSFLAITGRRVDNAFNVLKSILNDTTRVQTHFGCIYDNETIADLCINIVTKRYSPAYEDYVGNNYQLTIPEKEELDSIIINSNLELRYRDFLIEQQVN